MTTSIHTCYGTNSRQIKPAVVNLFQNNNAVDSIEFQIEKYNQDNVDLSTLDPYVICHGSQFVGGLDEVKLTSEVTADGILRVYWDLTLMVLSSPQTISAQLVFKNNDGAVWTSYKMILFCNESLTADEEIVAQYPTILKQMEKRIDDKTDEAAQGAVEQITNNVAGEMNNAIQIINNMAGDFDAGVIYIPFGEHVPVEERISNRLYYQYTNGEHTQGRFEDYMGNVLVAEGSGGGGSSLPMFAPIWSDHLYNDASYLRADNFSWHNSAIYVTAYAKLVEQYNHENSVEMTDGDITYKLTPDGFRIADASQHDDVRYAYENKGRAWYYILDEENARFKLPREKNTSNKYLYFYVGNYERPETEVNIGILTELANGTDISVIKQEINEIKDQALAEVEASGGINNKITNCITEIPQRIKLELVNNVLTLKAGSEVYYNGDYYVTDQDYTYAAPTTLPTKQFIIAANVDKKVLEQATLDNTGSYSTHEGTDNRMWFNTTDLKCYLNDAADNYTQISYPIAIVNCTSNKGFTSIAQTFNGFGYIGSTIWVDKDVKGLVPNGRNANGTLNNIEHISEKLKIYTLTSGFKDRTNQLVVWDDNTNVASVIGVTYDVVNDGVYPSVNYSVVFDETLNRFLYNSNTGIYVEKNWIGVGFVTTNSNANITSFNVKQPFKVLDYSDLEDVHCVVETYKNGAFWYRVWSDGWCEQGGIINGAGTVNLMKPFSDDNYSVSITPVGTPNTYLSVVTSTSLTFEGGGGRWMVYGYLA